MALKREIPAKAITLLPWIFMIVVAAVAYRAVTHVTAEYAPHSAGNMSVIIEPGQLIGCLAIASSSQPRQTGIAPKTLVTSTNNDVLTVSADALKLCLANQKTPSQSVEEIFKPRVDEMKWMLTVIATIAGFFAIAQAGAAWFTAQVYTKQAEESLKSITSIQEGIKARYPLFERVEAARNNALTALDQVFFRTSKAPDKQAGSTEALDWKDNLYLELEMVDRQQLLSTESFVSIDLDRGPFGDEKHADILRKFSLFYRAKFLYEDNLSKGTFSDLERAEGYLHLAYKKDRDFTFQNDLGSLYISYYSTLQQRGTNESRKAAGLFLEKAQGAFQLSLKLQPDQQRARYNLAVISGKYRRNFQDAINRLEETLTRSIWQREPSDYMTSVIHYNIACYESLSLQEQVTKGGSPHPLTRAVATKYLKPKERRRIRLGSGGVRSRRF